MIKAEYEIIHLLLLTNDNEQMRISDFKSIFLAKRLKLIWCISSNKESNDIHFVSSEKKRVNSIVACISYYMC